MRELGRARKGRATHNQLTELMKVTRARLYDAISELDAIWRTRAGMKEADLLTAMQPYTTAAMHLPVRAAIPPSATRACLSAES